MTVLSTVTYGHENEMYKYNIEGKGVRECMSVS